jgi:hypothetical protein
MSARRGERKESPLFELARVVVRHRARSYHFVIAV